MIAEKYLATVNEKTEIELTPAASHQLDAVQTGEGQYHILHNGKPYRAEVVSVDKQAKEVSLKVNGKLHTVKLQDEHDLLVKKMGLNINLVHKISAIKAPMPGLVLSILVEPGQAVLQGEPMLILEAMKMENVIKSPGEGTVKKVVVSKGKPVDKGEILIEMA
jgi:biotin carboxyl carrier protein